MEKNFFGNKKENKKPEQKKIVNESLVKAFELIHGAKPQETENWQIARRIVEVLDEPSQIPPDLAKECIYLITNAIEYPSDEIRINIVLMAEEKASKVFSELGHIDEVHMADIERAYYNWKKSANSG
ncbi:MAG: hypothetical protein NUV83_02455 [Candidatus Wolfebacteria bacterium]|nr:hypothetical protein [Candidatus Wolfebacteria bacterium]